MNTQITAKLTQSPAPCSPAPRSSWWTQLCDRLAAALLQRGEPVVTEKQDAQGCYWQIYDPYTNRSTQVRSQQEALIWLEQRHYQVPELPLGQSRR